MTDKTEETRKFQLGDRVTKTKGSNWTGRVVGFYSTSLTPIGYAVESETEKGSVQIYPESALRATPTRPDLAGIKGLVERSQSLSIQVAELPDGNAWPSTVELLCDLRDFALEAAAILAALKEVDHD